MSSIGMVSTTCMANASDSLYIISNSFIFNLSWKWRPEYGGLLHVENELGFQAYNPGWGDLVLLSLAEGKGENHFVSEVTKYAPRPRLAISGWFNEGEE